MDSDKPKGSGKIPGSICRWFREKWSKENFKTPQNYVLFDPVFLEIPDFFLMLSKFRKIQVLSRDGSYKNNIGTSPIRTVLQNEYQRNFLAIPISTMVSYINKQLLNQIYSGKSGWRKSRLVFLKNSMRHHISQ